MDTCADCNKYITCHYGHYGTIVKDPQGNDIVICSTCNARRIGSEPPDDCEWCCTKKEITDMDIVIRKKYNYGSHRKYKEINFMCKECIEKYKCNICGAGMPYTNKWSKHWTATDNYYYIANVVKQRKEILTLQKVYECKECDEYICYKCSIRGLLCPPCFKSIMTEEETIALLNKVKLDKV